MTLHPEDEGKLAEAIRMLEALEAVEERRRELAKKNTNDKGQKLLSYEAGFSWCSKCFYVSSVSKISELKLLGLKGCQRRGCEGCRQWGFRSPYEPEYFCYEGPKADLTCPWYESGKGCPKGNNCNLERKHFDVSLKENKVRCFVCGEKNDHMSKYCERLEGKNEGFQLGPDFQPGALVMPRRPNGSEPCLPEEITKAVFRKPMPEVPNITKEEHENMNEKQRLARRAKIAIRQARVDICAKGHTTEELDEAMKTMATSNVEFEGKEELIEFLGGSKSVDANMVDSEEPRR